MQQRFRLTEKWLVCGLALISLLLHLAIISHGNQLIFDENYYVPEADSIIHDRELLSPEHPSLGKLFIASGIYLFGDNPWGGRIFSVIFGVTSVVLFYLICRKLGGKRIALFASLLLVFDNMTLVHSTLAMLDIFAVTFMLLSFLLYLQDRYALSGISIALSGLCKMTGVFGALVILAHWYLTERVRDTRSIGFFLVSGILAFFLLMPVADFVATGEWLNPFSRVYQMSFISGVATTGELTPEALSIVSYPWEWILNPIPSGAHYQPSHLHYNAIITPTIWALIIPSMCYMLYESVKNKRDISLFSLLWFGGTYVIWIPIQLLTDRVTYLFYFLPTVGAICLAIGFAASMGWRIATEAKGRPFGYLAMPIIAYLLLHVGLFFAFSPLPASLLGL